MFVKAALHALPDSLINGAPKTDDVLRRTIDTLDLRKLLGNLNDSRELTRQINAAVTNAVQHSPISRLRNPALIPARCVADLHLTDRGA